MPPSDRRTDRLLAGAAAASLGALHAASFSPPLQTWWLQLLALAGLFRLLADAPARARMLLSIAFALGWFVTGLSWLHTSMHVYGGMPWLLAAIAVVLFAGYLALFPALAIEAAIRMARARGTFARSLHLAAFWGLAELLRGLLFTGFPWLSVGYAHVDGPLSGFAPWIGVYGIGSLAVLVAALASGLSWRRWRASGLPVALAGAILAGGWQLAAVEPTQANGPPVRVRLVQGNVPQQLKFEPQRALDAMLEYTGWIESAQADLVVLPETAWTIPWRATPPSIRRRVASASARSGASLAIGMPLQAPGPAAPAGRPYRYTNSVALVAPDADGLDARVVERYDKHHLVPFGEFIPPGFGWFVALMQIPLGEFGRGALVQPPFLVAGQRFAFNICYEDLFGEELIGQVRAPHLASVLVNVSNIAWFGDSRALPQHLAIARMRTLETGRPMLRATNTGVTAAIDHRGRVIAMLAPYTQGALDVSVQGTSGLTAYVRHGNLLALALLAALLALGQICAFRSRAPKKLK